MSILVLLLPARPRLGADAAPDAGDGAELPYVLTPDGLSVASQGRAAPAVLPRADTVVAVVSPADVSWHPITLPKAPASRLRAALVGLLEEQLLDEDEALHFALSPGATAGQPAWVAVLHRPWLAAQLGALERAGLFVERVVPSIWPGDAAIGHFFTLSPEADGSSADTWLAHADGEGAHCLRLAGALARAAVGTWTAQSVRWSATPSVAAQAERWLGAPVMVQSEAEGALQAVRSLWNLRQFDLAPRHRGTRALRDAIKQLRSPAWRPARIGLASLLVLQVAGLNLSAWSQQRAIGERRQAMVELLKQAHPQVRAVLDAPLQMRRETELLRAAAGRSGDGDLEALLAAAALAWPPGQAPVSSLRFEPGRLTLAASGWSPEQIDEFRSRLRPAGWAVEAAEGRLTILRAADAPPPNS